MVSGDNGTASESTVEPNGARGIGGIVENTAYPHPHGLPHIGRAVEREVVANKAYPPGRLHTGRIALERVISWSHHPNRYYFHPDFHHSKNSISG